MFKKFVASLMAALMAVVTIATPALAATALNTYPTFLGKSGDFYVVVGKNAATSDVAGAIDVASNLAQLSYTDVAGSTSSTGLTGTDRKIAIPSSSSGSYIGASSPNSNQFPATLKTYHYSALKESQFEFKGTKYNYHEQVALATSGTGLLLTHMLTSPVNGTLKMRVEQSGVEYQHVFDTAVAGGSVPTAANSTSYSTPLKVTIAGKEFNIVAIPSSTSFIALVGNVGWVTQGDETGIAAGDLKAVVDTVYSGTQAAVRIVDASGNTVTNLGVVGTTTQSFTYGGSTYNLKILQTATVSVAGAGENRAQLLFGKGDIEKTFDGSTSSYVSDWGADWKIGAANLGTNGGIAASSYIFVRYYPDSLTDASRYFVAGSVFKGPGDYFELSYSGYYPGKFAKVTIESSGTVTYYNSTATTGYETDSVSGLKLSTDTAGTLVYGGTGYDEMYLLFNESKNGDNFNGTKYIIAYKDKTTSRVVNLTAPAEINTSTGYNSVDIGLSYGGGGSVTYHINTTFKDATLINSAATYPINVSLVGSSVDLGLNFTNRTASSTSLTPDLMLGLNSGTADANDIKARVEGGVSDVATQVGDLITDGGVVAYSVKSNTESNKVVIGIPPETVYGLVQFGKVGPASTTTGGTVKQVVAITTAVAKLDSEITSTDKANKNLVLIGGPCANTLVQALVDAGKLDSKYTCAAGNPGAAWVKNTAYIIATDDAFATGKTVVTVAGTSADDTRLASTVLQQYATKLSGIIDSDAVIEGTAIATATVS
jgi:hypothetical protein